MTIPKPSQTKQPILKLLSNAGKPVKIAHITESVGKHFKLTKKELAEEMPRGGKKFATKIGDAVNEMKSAGLVKSPRHGHVAITAKGKTGLQEGNVTDRRRKPGRPKIQTAKQSSATPIKQDDKMIQRTADIVSSYVGKKAVSANQVSGLIKSVYATLQGLGSSKPRAKRKYTRRKKVAKKKA